MADIKYPDLQQTISCVVTWMYDMDEYPEPDEWETDKYGNDVLMHYFIPNFFVTAEQINANQDLTPDEKARNIKFLQIMESAKTDDSEQALEFRKNLQLVTDIISGTVRPDNVDVSKYPMWADNIMRQPTVSQAKEFIKVADNLPNEVDRFRLFCFMVSNVRIMELKEMLLNRIMAFDAKFQKSPDIVLAYLHLIKNESPDKVKEILPEYLTSIINIIWANLGDTHFYWDAALVNLVRLKDVVDAVYDRDTDIFKQVDATVLAVLGFLMREIVAKLPDNPEAWEMDEADVMNYVHKLQCIANDFYGAGMAGFIKAMVAVCPADRWRAKFAD